MGEQHEPFNFSYAQPIALARSVPSPLEQRKIHRGQRTTPQGESLDF
ncbi:hypothetical protein RISK_004376 [Rhodopirellula islandica]|uniref:Uncharacterized protein n=1 Tax=Rhodopirellula islandica TaxID=595434 RepID=A0A0J1BA33_RHOIS|nr:hypothetical protein RISK_004376 [Rhodopirellula islandica]